MKTFRTINDKLVAIQMENHSIGKIMEEKKVDIKRSVDSILTTKKYGSIGKSRITSADKKKNTMLYNLEICERINKQLYIARSRNWHCCVYRNRCLDIENAENIYKKLSFIKNEKINHKNLLPIIEINQILNEIQIFVSNPSITLNDYLNQQRYELQNSILSVDCITNYALQLAKAIKYLHSRNIIHRCINTSKIYFILPKKGEEKQILLNPFFLCKEDDPWDLTESNFSYVDENIFIAPEIGLKISTINNDNNEFIKIENNFTFSSDIWSFGIVLYQLLTLQFPYNENKNEEEEEILMKQAPILPKFFQTKRLRTRTKLLNEEKNKNENTQNKIDITSYQPLIDLFRFCTNIDPSQRPNIKDIVKSLKNNINIKEMCGIAVSRGPGSLKDWVDNNRTFVGLKSIDNNSSSLIKQTENFIIEEPVQKNTLNPCYIQYIDKSFPYYEKHLSLLPHENYLGTFISNSANLIDVDEFIFISIEIDGQFIDDQWCYKALIRTKSKDIRILILCENSKDRLKNLKSHRFLNNNYTLHVLKDPSIPSLFINFEQKHLEPKTYKFGVIYRKAGQISDNDMLGNEHGSTDFAHFLNFLGDSVELKGWKDFRGGLDIIKDTTGKKSIYTKFGEFEIMFHVSTLLPFDKGNPQQLHRKRHIGNDVIVIIFQDRDCEPFTPQFFTSHFNHVFCVVKVHHRESTLIFDDDEFIPSSSDSLRTSSAPAIYGRDIFTATKNSEKVYYQ